MKKYIFLTDRVDGYSGAPLYIKEKSRYLLTSGWDVCVACNEGPSSGFLDDGVAVVKNYLFMACPSYLALNQVASVIEEVKEAINFCDGDSVLLESSNPASGLWGEVIAQSLSGKHVVFMLDEKWDVCSREERCFIRFKLERGEFAGIKETIVESLFEEADFPRTQYDYKLFAYLPDAIEDVPPSARIQESLMQMKGFDHNILVFSRLEKSFVREMSIALIDYVANKTSGKTLITYIGGDADGRTTRAIGREADRFSNVTVRFLGEMHPIPAVLFEGFDLGIAKAGCSYVCQKTGMMNIRYAIDEDYPLGLYSGARFVKGSDDKSLEFLLAYFFGHQFKEMRGDVRQESRSSKNPYDDFFQFVEQSESKREYYPTSTIQLFGKRRIQSLWIRVFKKPSYRSIYKLNSTLLQLIDRE